MRPATVTREVVDYVLARSSEECVIELARELIDASHRGSPAEIGDAVADQLMARPELGLGGAMDRLSACRAPAAHCARARMLAEHGDCTAAIAALDSAIGAMATADEHVLLQRARLLAREKRNAEAIADLRSALQRYPTYPFFLRCEKLVERLRHSPAWKPRQRVKLACLGSSTTALLDPVIQAVGFRNDLDVEVYQGVYGNYCQEILDPESGLYAFKPDAVVLLVNHRDLNLPPSDTMGQASCFCSRLRELWKILQKRCPTHVIQIGLDVPEAGGWGFLEDTLSDGRRRAIIQANLALSENLPAGVSFLDVNAIVARIGREFWSAAEWHRAKQYPSTAAIPLLADPIGAHLLAALGLARKTLVVDLDNTLWGGVIGEDLLGGIRIGPPTAEGEGYLELQRYIKELKDRGVLLAVCSKNNRADAELPFRSHDAMLLRLDDFVAFSANWNDKASNLRAMANELSLGLDSFVFLDDNPIERRLVRMQLPEVAVPECGATPWEMLESLRRGLYFPSFALTREDMQRHASYRSNAARKVAEHDAASVDDFLASLDMAVEHGAVDETSVARVAQLINKTNQFNLTTRRYTEEQVRAMAKSPDWWCHWFRLADRFGDYGLVGVMMAQISGDAWRVDTWLMSCRVLGRCMEQFMASVLLRAARDHGASHVVGQFIATEKNALVKDLYLQMGFASDESAAGQYAFDFTLGHVPECPFIRDKTDDSVGVALPFPAVSGHESVAVVS
jgi:FkbH-like protein